MLFRLPLVEKSKNSLLQHTTDTVTGHRRAYDGEVYTSLSLKSHGEETLDSIS